MAEARACPHCGASLPPEGATANGPPAVSAAGDTRADQDLDRPPVPLLAPGSQDDNVFGSGSGTRIAETEPDPILGEFVTPSSGASGSALLEPPPRSRSGEGFPAIDLGSKPRNGRAARPSTLRAGAGDDEDDDDEGVEVEGRGTTWATILLASYASAVTLGLAWTLMQGRSRAPEPPAEAPRPTPAAPAPASAKLAGLSRKVEPPEPILGEHFAAMGRPLRVGDLEVTPVDVRREAITLRRANALSGANRRDGGKGALILRLRLKNTSNDAVFAPLDQAYLRERGNGLLDTYVETAGGDRIYPYPLAVESEWAIPGQEFTALRPGESRVAAIVSAPDAPPDSAGPFTWRVRLRTGINRTDTLGVREGGK